MPISTSTFPNFLFNEVMPKQNGPVFFTNCTPTLGGGVSAAFWQDTATPSNFYTDELTQFAGCDGRHIMRTRPALTTSVSTLSYRYVHTVPVDIVHGIATWNFNIPYLLKPSETNVSFLYYFGDNSTNKAGDVSPASLFTLNNTDLPMHHPISFVHRCNDSYNGVLAVEMSVGRNPSQFTSANGEHPEIGDIWPVRFWAPSRKPIRGFPIDGLARSDRLEVPDVGGGSRYVSLNRGRGRWLFEYMLTSNSGTPFPYNDYEHMVHYFWADTGEGSHNIGMAESGSSGVVGDIFDFGPTYMCQIEEFKVREVNRDLHRLTMELKEVPPTHVELESIPTT